MLLAVLLQPAPSFAVDDARMLVEVSKQELPAGGAGLQGAIKAAAPRLWDRLLPRTERGKAEALPANLGLITRIRPTIEGYQVEFNREAVLAQLSEVNITYLQAAPRLQIAVQLTNRFGQRMVESEALLQAYLRNIAPRWGVVLADDAPALVLSWQWFADDPRVHLVVRGDTPLMEFNEARTLAPGDFMPELQAWAEALLVAARDAYAVNAEVTTALARDAQGDWQVGLTIARDLDLAAQVAWEDALRADPRIKALLPYRLSAKRQSYRLRLNTRDDTWLPRWFQSHGLELQPSAEGWLAQ